LAVSTAKKWRATAAAVTPALRTLLDNSGVFVSYTVLREGARTRGGQVLDPGYVKLLHLIEDAKTAGVDRVNHATYQTVLGTAPPLAAVMDPSARESDGVIDYVTEVNNSPNRNELVRFTADRAQAIAELCDGAEAAITAVRDLATGSALDDAALAKFLDENSKLL
jgi:hypothetical protein